MAKKIFKGYENEDETVKLMRGNSGIVAAPSGYSQPLKLGEAIPRQNNEWKEKLLWGSVMVIFYPIGIGWLIFKAIQFRRRLMVKWAAKKH